MQERERGESVAQAAQLVGIGTRTVYAAQAIAKESPELFEKIKSGEKTVDKAYRELHPRKETRKEGLKPLKVGEKQNLCHNYAVMAMTNMDRIQKGDPQGRGALLEVLDYINQRLEKVH